MTSRRSVVSESLLQEELAQFKVEIIGDADARTRVERESQLKVEVREREWVCTPEPRVEERQEERDFGSSGSGRFQTGNVPNMRSGRLATCDRIPRRIRYPMRSETRPGEPCFADNQISSAFRKLFDLAFPRVGRL